MQLYVYVYIHIIIHVYIYIDLAWSLYMCVTYGRGYIHVCAQDAAGP